MDDKSLLVDSSELAKLLKVSRTTLWRMLEDGRLPATVESFSQPRWNRKSIESWVDAGCPKINRLILPNDSVTLYD